MLNGLFVIGEIRGIREHKFTWVDKQSGEQKEGIKRLLKVETDNGDYEFQLGNDIYQRREELASLKGRAVMIPVNIWKDRKGYLNSFYRGTDLPRPAPSLKPVPAVPAVEKSA